VFIGHFAVGFATKRLAPRASLGPLLAAPLLAAPLLADLLWPVFLLLGMEQVQINAPGVNPFRNVDIRVVPMVAQSADGGGVALLFGGAYHLITDMGEGGGDRPRRREPLGARCRHAFSRFAAVALELAVGRARLVELRASYGDRRGPDVRGGVWVYSSGTTGRDRIGRFAWWDSCCS
jgi:hypothetical protein